MLKTGSCYNASTKGWKQGLGTVGKTQIWASSWTLQKRKHRDCAIVFSDFLLFFVRTAEIRKKLKSGEVFFSKNNKFDDELGEEAQIAQSQPRCQNSVFKVL